MIVTLKSGTKFDVFRHVLGPENIRHNDFVEIDGQLARILEIQRGCPSINKFGSGFTICLVETTGGKRTTFRPVRSVQVWRGKRV